MTVRSTDRATVPTMRRPRIKPEHRTIRRFIGNAAHRQRRPRHRRRCSSIRSPPPTAYLAGIALNLSVASALVLVLAATGTASTVHRLSAAALLSALMPLPFQLMVFTRTDVYFVLQDLTGCRDLDGDGLALRPVPVPADPARAASRRPYAGGRTTRAPEPPGHERRAVRVYGAVLVVGTAACLAFMAAVTLPLDIALLARAVRGLAPGNDPAGYADAAAVL
ncbi:hypothetical protein STENM223S_01821 [Streptomyces tendae]